MNISLPGELKRFVDERTLSGMFGSTSEYVRELIRSDQERLRFREMLLDAAASPVSATADEAYFDELRRRVGTASSEPDRDNEPAVALPAE